MTHDAHEDCTVHWLCIFAMYENCDIKERLQVRCDMANDFLNCVLSNI